MSYEPLLGLVIPNKVIVLKVISVKVSSLLGGISFILLRTFSILSHMKVYLGTGLSLDTPFRSLHIDGCFPTVNPSMGA